MSLDCCSTSPRSRTLSLLLVSNGRALTVAAARSRPLRKRSPALLPLAAVTKRWSREPNHNPVSNRTVTYPPGSCPSLGPGNRTTTRLVTGRSLILPVRNQVLRRFSPYIFTGPRLPSARPPAPFYKTARPGVLETKNSPWPVPSTQQAPVSISE
ncbi:unnamed protein product [Sphagnum jensenii]|uniref:Uncharacterized protein n=1 Tax=Sphagnum jensenii TaxID=128206 RepID=A0ABP1AM16_9BRYO